MDFLESNTEWKQWGKQDPLFGVASWANKEKGSVSAWTDEEFYALGESDWRDFYRIWQQYGVSRETCLEVGCGAGRITRQLVNSFDHVQAVDVSEDMIKYARERIGAKNLQFFVVDGIHLPQPDGSVRAIFSTHVLQHLDNVNIGLSYFHEFFRVLDLVGPSWCICHSTNGLTSEVNWGLCSVSCSLFLAASMTFEPTSTGGEE